MSVIQIAFLALVLDFLIGDPPRLWSRVPHPAMLMGQAIDWCDQRLNRGNYAKASGILVIGLLVIGMAILGWVLKILPDFGILEVLVLAVLLAFRSLVQHVQAVADGLREGLDSARAEVSMIVGRDTQLMGQNEIVSAAVESAAENYSDGVIAPLFWFLILGLPGVLIYKMVNTADSMIGHLNPRYEKFGFAAAKLDDLMNWIPARATGLLFCAVYRAVDAWEMTRSEAPLHRSPNAGWPEAAMASVLDIRIGGPRSYGAGQSDDVHLNPMGRKELDADDIKEAVKVLTRSHLVLIAVFGVFGLLIWLF